MRYIFLAAVTVHARGRLSSSLRAPPVPGTRPPADRRAHDRAAVGAVDLPSIMVRAEEEHPPARRHHTLNESSRAHAAMATAGNWIVKAETCESFRTSPAVATMGSERPTPGPTLSPSGRSSTPPATRANYPARSDSRTLGRSPTFKRPRARCSRSAAIPSTWALRSESRWCSTRGAVPWRSILTSTPSSPAPAAASPSTAGVGSRRVRRCSFR